MAPTSRIDTFDEIDTEILRILAENPRTPYADIADRLEEAGYEMSDEGVRYRVSKIFERTTLFFLIDPEELTWEILRVAVTAADYPGAKEEAFDAVCDLPFWHVSVGVGTFDLFAVGSAPSMKDVDALVTTLRETESIAAVDHLVVTGRNRDMNSYLSMDYISE